jgi:ferritin-like metal-binding protein YciE
MAKNATSEGLVTTITDHLLVTKEQVSRLEKVFDLIGEKAAAKKCDAMEGLIEEGEGIIEETQEGLGESNRLMIVPILKLSGYFS